MATLATDKLTLLEWAKRQDPDGKVADVAELLAQTNEILDDAVFVEGNLPTGHRSVIRTGLPSVYWRSINQGVPSSRSQTAQVDDAAGMLEAYARVDKRLAELNGDAAAFRMSEEAAFIEAMNQAQASAMFYGNPATDPRQYLGLAARYGLTSAGNGANILSAGGAASANTSIYLVGWSPRTVFGIFPKGSKAGLDVKDHGELTIYDENNNPFQAYQTHYSWMNGLVVKDWRYVVRIANIDSATFAAMSGTQAVSAVSTNIIHMMARACDRIPSPNGVRLAFYMNRSVHSLLRRMALEKSVNSLAIQTGLNQFGNSHSWMTFDGVPLRKVDQLLNTEATVA